MQNCSSVSYSQQGKSQPSVVSREELEANPQLTSASLICQKHNDKFRFFDEKFGHAVCRECVALEHFGHLCLPLAEAASEYGKEVKDLMKKTNVETGSAVEYELEMARLEKEVGYLQGLLKKVKKVRIIMCCLG